uniref:High mobility group 20A n=1 Tax=Peromyscus maniculatus bairdii TaxID=230844 RepID=A0A8C8UL40_PERMB
MESLMTPSSLPPLFADEDGSKESSDLAATGLTHPEGPYGSTATSSTNNPEFVEDLSQGQLLQSESSNAADGSEQRHEDEVSNLLSLSSGASKATMQGAAE